jgi:hypothetical protein
MMPIEDADLKFLPRVLLGNRDRCDLRTGDEHLKSSIVGRPGLNPGTLGFEPERAAASVVVRVAWSKDYASPPTSADVLSNLLPWLHGWLHSLGCGVSSVVQISGSDGLKIEVCVEGPIR